MAMCWLRSSASTRLHLAVDLDLGADDELLHAQKRGRALATVHPHRGLLLLLPWTAATMARPLSGFADPYGCSGRRSRPTVQRVEPDNGTYIAPGNHEGGRFRIAGAAASEGRRDPSTHCCNADAGEIGRLAALRDQARVTASH